MVPRDIAGVVEPVLAAAGLELDDLEIIPAGKRSLVRITVDGDGPKGRGPLLDDIALATREISRALDESQVTGSGSYTLEVSSRGTSRPLTLPKHYRRNRGRLLKVTLADQIIEGRIRQSDDDGVFLELSNGTQKQVIYTDIIKALIQVELNRPFDPDLDADDDACEDCADSDVEAE